MILTVPFAYEVVGYEPRKRNVTINRRRGETMVEVREVNPSDMPVALVWKQPPDHVREDERLVSIRTHDGGLWVRADASTDTPRDDREGSGGSLSGEALAEAIRAGRHSGNPFAGFLADIPREGKPEIFFAREVRSGKQDAEAGVAARASELVAMGGELFLRCPEPVFRRDSCSGYDRASRSLSVDWYEAGRGRPTLTGGIYRADEWGRLREDARRLHDDYPGMFDLPERQAHFQVLIPEALTLPTEGMALAGHALAVLDKLGDVLRDSMRGFERKDDSGRNPGNWSAPMSVDMPEPDIVEAWGRLGNALAGGLDADGIGTLRDVFAIEVEVDPEETWRRRSLAEALVEARAALARWDARPDHMPGPPPRRVDEADVAAFAELGSAP